MDYPVTSTDTGADREVRNYLRGTDDYMPDALFLLPGCDEEITLRRTLAETAQQFCRETGCFEYEKVVTLTNGVTRYALSVPWPADVLNVKTCKVYGTTAAGVETFRYSLLPLLQFTVEDPTDEAGVYINLVNALDSATGGDTYSLKVALALVPHFDELMGTQATALPDKWLRRWRSGIVAGAVAALAAMTQKRWSDEALAADSRKRYDFVKGEALSKARFSQMLSGGQTCLNPLPWC
jgi:hypothetical protein